MLCSHRLPSQVHGPVRSPQRLHLPPAAFLPLHELRGQPVPWPGGVPGPGGHGGGEGGGAVVPGPGSHALGPLCHPRVLVPGEFLTRLCISNLS